VVVVQRFGSALNLNVHFHVLVQDGVHTAASPLERPVLHPAPELNHDEVAGLVGTLRDRVVRLLRRRGLWPAPGEEDVPDEPEPESLLPFLSAASIQGRVALGPDAGRRVERLGQTAAEPPSFEPGRLCAATNGFSLHAQVHVAAGDRERLEHLLTYHGVLAPASSWRDEIVPTPPAAQAPIATIPHPLPSTSARALRPPASDPPPPETAPDPPPWGPNGAELLKRVFEIAVLHCQHCGGRRRLIALITEPLVVRRILRDLDLPCEPPPIAPARPPPQMVLGF
jgi:Putative transposase